MAANAHSGLRRFWQTLASVRTGIILLIALVIVSAAGTLILQRPLTDPDELQRAYSPQSLRWLDLLGLTDVFHAWWFALLLGLLSLTLVLASLQRFPNAWRFFARPYRRPDSHFRATLPLQKQIPVRDQESGREAAERALARMGLKPQRVQDPAPGQAPLSLFAERHRFSVLAAYIVHASLLLIFLGGMVDALYGYRGFIALLRGQQTNQLELRDGSKRTLPFSVRCEAAGQENYADGTPKRWWSQLAVVENGRLAQRKEIAVNDPLIYRGLRFYQSSFGSSGELDKVLLTAVSAGGKGGAQEIELGLQETRSLDSDTTVQLAQFVPDFVVRDNQIYTRSNQPDNPAMQLVVTSRRSGKTAPIWLFPQFSELSHDQNSPYNFRFRDLRMGYFTGLQVSHEPGQWAVWVGCVLMGLGLAVAFYLVHMRFWVMPVNDERGRLVLWVGAAANKNREAFEQRFRNLVEEIQKELQAQPQPKVAAHRSLARV